ncbi:MAG: hypothetical protein WBC06_07450 [Chitinophagaceae bacterium]
MKKNRFVIAFFLILIVATISSCATQKYGCPGNPGYSSRFKG